MSTAALLKAISMKGSGKNLSKDIGATPDQLNAWKNRGVQVPMHFALDIQRVTNGEVCWLEIAPHLEHYAKRWSGFLIFNNLFTIQVMHIALSCIGHKCHIQTQSEVFQCLANDIRRRGLQRPICVDTDNDLIFGEKRLHAYEMLGKKTIPAWRLSLIDLINHQYGKEGLLHTFVFSERVYISLAIEKLLGHRQGQRTDLSLRQNFVEVKGRTDEFIAELLGFGNRQTYQQAKKICQLGSRELIDAVDHGHLAISTAAAITQFSIEEQKQILSWNTKRITTFVAQLRQHKSSDFSIANFNLEEPTS